jgi:micrococcal nuclease
MSTVARVVDGDTIELVDSRVVRLIGIDTPETKHPDLGVQCFGPEAAAKTAALLPVGTRIHLRFDIERRDRYQRTLAYVFRASDGLFVNAALVRYGFARSYPYSPNLAFERKFTMLEERARAVGRGLWARC